MLILLPLNRNLFFSLHKFPVLKVVCMSDRFNSGDQRAYSRTRYISKAQGWTPAWLKVDSMSLSPSGCLCMVKRLAALLERLVLPHFEEKKPVKNLFVWCNLVYRLNAQDNRNEKAMWLVKLPCNRLLWWVFFYLFFFIIMYLCSWFSFLKNPWQMVSLSRTSNLKRNGKANISTISDLKSRRGCNNVSCAVRMFGSSNCENSTE